MINITDVRGLVKSQQTALECIKCLWWLISGGVSNWREMKIVAAITWLCYGADFFFYFLVSRGRNKSESHLNMRFQLYSSLFVS